MYPIRTFGGFDVHYTFFLPHMVRWSALRSVGAGRNSTRVDEGREESAEPFTLLAIKMHGAYCT